jgi:outer membrane cobalamin receptor
MHRGLKNALLGTSGIGLIFVGGTTAYAQEALETVVVTAEKQATDIQKTGVSITAIQPADLAAAGQTRLADALAAVPSVQIYRAAQSTNG